MAAIAVKATIKCLKGIDVRMSIGIGGKEYDSARITEANGEAFINSGEQLEKIKKEKQTLSLKTPWPEFDKEMNLIIQLGLIEMENWSQGAAELMKVSLERPNAGQQKIADLLGISQSSVSERQKRAHYNEIVQMENFYRERLKTIVPLTKKFQSTRIILK
jgi:hypothetical protein